MFYIHFLSFLSVRQFSDISTSIFRHFFTLKTTNLEYFNNYLTFSLKNRLISQHEFENQGQWLPERSSLDSRIRSGTHQNWGLWEETKSKMKPEDFTIQSDYTANYHGKI